MGNPRIPLQPDTYYHIYNKAVGDEKLFRCYYNYEFFLENLIKYLSPSNELLAYCLLPNHFHLLIKTNSENELILLWKEKIKQRLFKHYRIKLKSLKTNKPDSKLRITINSIIDKLIIEQYSNCFNSYVQSYNKTYNRMGSLLKESFQRKQINSNDYLRTLVFYIHYNPVKHGLVSKMHCWPHSSYRSILSKTVSPINSESILNLFGGQNAFMEYHNAIIPE